MAPSTAALMVPLGSAGGVQLFDHLLLARLRTLQVEDEVGPRWGVDLVLQVDGEVDADHGFTVKVALAAVPQRERGSARKKTVMPSSPDVGKRVRTILRASKLQATKRVKPIGPQRWERRR